MRKTLKKTLSLVLALILLVSTMSFAFAITYGEPITEDEAKEIAMKYIAHSSGIDSVKRETYQSVDAYKVVSDVVINNKLIKTTIGIWYVNVLIFNILRIFNIPQNKAVSIYRFTHISLSNA